MYDGTLDSGDAVITPKVRCGDCVALCAYQSTNQLYQRDQSLGLLSSLTLNNEVQYNLDTSKLDKGLLGPGGLRSYASEIYGPILVSKG